MYTGRVDIPKTWPGGRSYLWEIKGGVDYDDYWGKYNLFKMVDNNIP